jgi:lipopolysaccharide/colanic/teichoic acid biosynthesis glycosyltransferase
MKRAFDVTVASLGLVLTSPLILAAAVAVKSDSEGPVIFSGPRVGRDGVVFRMHKLRTMRAGADRAGPAVTAGDDPRVTRVGRFLRRTKIDELPQLWNVVKGDMSLVGPRPEHPDYVAHYTAEQRQLLAVRPGITGPATLAYIDEERLLSAGGGEGRYVDEVLPRKLALELQYVRVASFGSDLAILVKTAARVVRRSLSAS